MHYVVEITEISCHDYDAGEQDGVGNDPALYSVISGH